MTAQQVIETTVRKKFTGLLDEPELQQLIRAVSMTRSRFSDPPPPSVPTWVDLELLIQEHVVGTEAHLLYGTVLGLFAACLVEIDRLHTEALHGR